jgi:hypothetical protein
VPARPAVVLIYRKTLKPIGCASRKKANVSKTVGGGLPGHLFLIPAMRRWADAFAADTLATVDTLAARTARAAYSVNRVKTVTDMGEGDALDDAATPDDACPRAPSYSVESVNTTERIVGPLGADGDSEPGAPCPTCGCGSWWRVSALSGDPTGHGTDLRRRQISVRRPSPAANRPTPTDRVEADAVA